MGLIWGRQDPSGPHVDPINFPIWVSNGMVQQGEMLPCGGQVPVHFVRIINTVVTDYLVTQETRASVAILST